VIEIGNPVTVGCIIFSGVLFVYGRWALSVPYKEIRPLRWGQLHRWSKRRPDEQVDRQRKAATG
jgi:hypothetical protein